MRTVLLVLSVVLSVGCASTKSAEGTAPSAAVADLKKPGQAVLGDRTTCPVSGETFTVAADSPKVEFEGKTYFFCCEDCVADFQKDPAKYVAKSAAP
jgi:YHS domain-containing protein